MPFRAHGLRSPLCSPSAQFPAASRSQALTAHPRSSWPAVSWPHSCSRCWGGHSTSFRNGASGSCTGGKWPRTASASSVSRTAGLAAPVDELDPASGIRGQRVIRRVIPHGCRAREAALPPASRAPSLFEASLLAQGAPAPAHAPSAGHYEAGEPFSRRRRALADVLHPRRPRRQQHVNHVERCPDLADLYAGSRACLRLRRSWHSHAFADIAAQHAKCEAAGRAACLAGPGASTDCAGGGNFATGGRVRLRVVATLRCCRADSPWPSPSLRAGAGAALRASAWRGLGAR